MTNVATAWLAGLLCIAAASKWVAEHPDNALVSMGVARGVGVIEIVLAVLCRFGWARRGVAFVVIALCMIGTVLYLLFPDRPCGCVGGAPRWVHLVLTCVMGVCACCSRSGTDLSKGVISSDRPRRPMR